MDGISSDIGYASLSSKKERQTMKQEIVTENDTQNRRPVIPEEYQINLSDFALFLSVMKNPRAYTDVLSIILDEPELKLTEVKVEQVVLNKSGRRAIRLDAWAVDERARQFDMEMQNDAAGDDLRKRARFYQGLLDTPVLKSGRETRYKHLPSTTIIFITREDIFEKDLAKYTFSEWCEEVPELPLEDGTKKIFLNMTSKNGTPELVSLLQYMKNTTLDNDEIVVRDERILELDRIVEEVRQSEEWEAVRMNILEIGIKKGLVEGMEKGIEKGIKKGMEKGIEKGKGEMILAMLKNGYPYSEVAKVADMTEEEIKRIEKDAAQAEES